MDDLEKSKRIVLEFVNEYLGGDINKLKDFSFSNLIREKSKYGDFGKKSKKARIADADDTLLSRGIYYLLHYKQIKGLRFDDIGTGQRYRGDTMNSFNSLFRWTIDKTDDEKHPILQENKEIVKNRLQEVLEKENLGIYSDFENKIKNFQKTYHRVGNFMLLYNESIEKNTINCARGKDVRLQDFFDLFLLQVQDKIELGACSIRSLNTLFDDHCCSQYLQNSFSKFCENNILDMYVKDNVVQLYKINSLQWPRYRKIGKRWRVIKSFNDGEVKHYYDCAVEYIDSATYKINERSKLIIEILKKELYK